jgi:hypothetical protein
LGTGADIVLNLVYNLFSSTGQWICNTVEDSVRQRKEGLENPSEEVIPID